MDIPTILTFTWIISLVELFRSRLCNGNSKRQKCQPSRNLRAGKIKIVPVNVLNHIIRVEKEFSLCTVTNDFGQSYGGRSSEILCDLPSIYFFRLTKFLPRFAFHIYYNYCWENYLNRKDITWFCRPWK